VNVSSDWKERAKREAEELDRKIEEERMQQQFSFAGKPTFLGFVQTMAANALIALGEVPNPLTGKQEVNLPQAKYAIDLLEMIKEKTQGNLTEDEQTELERVLTELRLKFVSVYNRLKEEVK